MLATDVRADAQDNLKACSLGILEESVDVVVDVGLVLALVGLELVPVDVREDGIQAHCTRHGKTLRPVLPWDPLRIHLAADELVVLAIEEEAGRVVPEAACCGESD